MLATFDLFWRTSPEGKKKSLPWGGCTTELLPGAPTTQSYDLICKVPKRILLKTVIPGWLWRGITPEGGKQKIPICNWRPKRGDCHMGSHPEREVYMLTTGFQPTNPIYGTLKEVFPYRKSFAFIQMQVRYCWGWFRSISLEIWHLRAKPEILRSYPICTKWLRRGNEQ